MLIFQLLCLHKLCNLKRTVESLCTVSLICSSKAFCCIFNYQWKTSSYVSIVTCQLYLTYFEYTGERTGFEMSAITISISSENHWKMYFWFLRCYYIVFHVKRVVLDRCDPSVFFFFCCIISSICHIRIKTVQLLSVLIRDKNIYAKWNLG